jgi:Uma2 family endonuclease
MACITQTITAQQLFETPGLERFELIEGELSLMAPPGFDHGYVVVEIAAALREFARARNLGVVVVEAGFVVSHDPDTVRSPDIAFVRAERIPLGGVKAFFQGPPDLAVEVISPGDRAGEVIAKAQQWLHAGCAAVWVVDPATKTATVYGQQPQALFLSVDDVLVCNELLPGFCLPLKQVFGGQT